METARIINTYLHNFWLECNIAKILELRDEIEGLNDEYLLSILHGEKHFVDIEGGMDLVDFETDEDWSDEAEGILFASKFEELTLRIVSYSFGMKNEFDHNDFEGFTHQWDLLNTYFNELEELRNNYKLFVRLTGYDPLDLDEILRNVYIDMKSEDAEDDLTQVRSVIDRLTDPVYEDEDENLPYEELVEVLLSKLDFDHLHIRNLLSLQQNYRGLEIMKISGTNGMELLTQYKEAQRRAEEARGNDIFPENILACIWNSGWLSPKGEFYGCADLNHVEFTDMLIKALEIETGDENGDRALELAGWIKFSCGRWLYNRGDLKPTKAQLEVIHDWVVKKADTYRVYLGEEFIGLDVLESLIRCANE